MSFSVNKYIRIIIIIGLFFATACDALRPFNPKAPLDKKWKAVASWIPAESSYILILDAVKIIETGLYQAPYPTAGIAVLTDGVLFIGGAFEPNEIIAKAEKELPNLRKTTYKNKMIFTDSPSKRSFSFLEKYLMCYGEENHVRKIIDRGANGPTPAGVVTDNMIWGRIKDVKKIFPNANEFLISANIDGSSIGAEAKARFANTAQASNFAEEFNGIKTLKSIQLMDDPAMAEVIDKISVQPTDKDVKMMLSLDISSAKTIIKRIIK